MSVFASGRPPGILAIDGPLMRLLSGVRHHFVVSLLTVVCALPVIAFTLLVGWQPRHLAIWLGVAALLPLGPACHAALFVARERMRARGDVEHVGRTYWAAAATSIRVLGWWWATVGLLGILLAYDLALFGASDAVFILGSAGAAVIAVVSVGLCWMHLDSPAAAPRSALVEVARMLGTRPHVALSWALLLVIVAAVPAIPVVGWSLVLFAPSLAASAAVIVATSSRPSSKRSSS